MITPQAAYAWQRGDLHACHQALGIMPWDVSPFHVDDPEPPEWVIEQDASGTERPYGAASWRRAWELRSALIELVGEPGPMDRHRRPLGVALPLSEHRG
jgi:hypothetical protein